VKVQQFSAVALIKIIDELDKMQKVHLAQTSRRSKGPAEYKEYLLQARDKWLTGVVPIAYSPKMLNIKIDAQDNGTLIIEFENIVFRINGDNVSKEQAI
jgi:hypothetical protein